MPGMSGPELADRLRLQFPGLPVLFLSGYPESTANRLGLDLRSINLLRKPFEPRDLLRRVADALVREQG